MKFKRLYTFGCSYTSFFWPTWADIIAYDTTLPFENWGIHGQGNVGITHRMVECDIKNKWDKDDLVLVLWSSWHREDRYIHKNWTQHGNIFNGSMKYYDRHFIKKYWDSNNDIIKNIGSMYLAKKSFPIAYEASITESKGLTYDGNILDFYKSYAPTEYFPWKHTSRNFEGALHPIDNHPDIKANLQYVEQYVYPAIGLKLKEETKVHFNKMQDYIVELGRSGATKKIKQWKELGPFFNEHLNHKISNIGF
jgi:hypothetical protein